MDPLELAENLYRTAVTEEQAAHRIRTAVDIGAVRQEVRRLAREEGVRIRTAVMNDVLVVVRADAALWFEPAQSMRRKLTPTD